MEFNLVVDKDGKFTMTGQFDKDPKMSGSGKNKVLVTTGGFQTKGAHRVSATIVPVK